MDRGRCVDFSRASLPVLPCSERRAEHGAPRGMPLAYHPSAMGPRYTPSWTGSSSEPCSSVLRMATSVGSSRIINSPARVTLERRVENGRAANGQSLPFWGVSCSKLTQSDAWLPMPTRV